MLSLETIHLHNNTLGGSIPDFISTDLECVDLDRNSLVGALPFFEATSSMKELRLEFNQLEGVLPLRLARLSHLEVLNLSHNHFHGPVPEQLRFFFTNLMSLDLEGNDNLKAVYSSQSDTAAVESISPEKELFPLFERKAGYP